MSGSVPPASVWPSLHPSHIHYKDSFYCILSYTLLTLRFIRLPVFMGLVKYLGEVLFFPIKMVYMRIKKVLGESFD